MRGSFSFPIPFIVLTLLLSLPPGRNSDPGSHSRLFSPPDGGPYLRNMNSCCDEKAQIVQPNTKLSVRNTAQNGQHQE